MRDFSFSVSFRYSDEQNYRPHACGISTLEQLSTIVGRLACLCDVRDIRIDPDLEKTDFKIFCP